ncbi:hypothetical protein BJ166DRAFT_90756 [Pestalotiopsis sp. NC0098]|nr:hypothetical protein BJ166DRAFT_90756 [Pestalotiopsis sp. NC0098]
MFDRLIEGFQTLSYSSLLGLGLLFGIAAANYKALPLISTLRILPAVLRLLKPRLPPWNKASTRRAASSPFVPASSSPAASPLLFRHHVTRSQRAVAADLDINMHKSNSTFFGDADVDRTRLLASLLSNGLAALGPANFILAGAQARFLREVRPYAAYDVSSRVLGWTDKSFYVVTYFLRPGARLPFAVEGTGGPQALFGKGADEKLRRSVYAVLVTRFVFKAGRETVMPEQVLRESGLLLDDEKCALGSGQDEKMLDGGSVEAVVKAGLEYVAHCME